MLPWKVKKLSCSLPSNGWIRVCIERALIIHYNVMSIDYSCITSSLEGNYIYLKKLVGKLVYVTTDNILIYYYYQVILYNFQIMVGLGLTWPTTKSEIWKFDTQCRQTFEEWTQKRWFEQKNFWKCMRKITHYKVMETEQHFHY